MTRLCERCGRPLLGGDSADAYCVLCNAGAKKRDVHPVIAGKTSGRQNRSSAQVRRSVKGLRDPLDERRKKLRRWVWVIGGIATIVLVSSQALKPSDEALPARWGGQGHPPPPCLLEQSGTATAAIAGVFQYGEREYYGALDGRDGSVLWKRRHRGGELVCFGPHYFGLREGADVEIHHADQRRPLATVQVDGVAVQSGAARGCISVLTATPARFDYAIPEGTPKTCRVDMRHERDQSYGIRACVDGAHLTPVTESGTYSLRRGDDGLLELRGAPDAHAPWTETLALDCAAGQGRVLAMTASPMAIVVIGAAPGSESNTMVAVSPADGSTLYRKPLPDLAQLRSLQFDGQDWLLEGEDSLSAFNTTTGDLRWTTGPTGTRSRH